MEDNGKNYDLGKKFEEEYAKVKQSIQKPNILLAGATGVGKSSLINMVFGEELAKVGTGKPVTQRIDVYENDNCDVRIFDSKGYELVDSDDDEFYGTVVNMAATTKKPEDAIHMIWYCIASNGARVQDYDLRALKAFSALDIPTAVLLTKADTPTEEEILAMRNQIPDSFKDSIFETSTKMPEYNHTKELIDWSIERLPESLRFAFISSQKADLKVKQKTARKYIKQQCALAFGVGFAPIPMSDAPLLIANEMSLIARILYLYDLGSISDIIQTTGLSSLLGGLLTSL
ncbi:MAG: 50S ribosome-binding GTPase, partial [Bacteroidales bacterium]|nr:50S ribosome-binding GTPase [Bacteroidales bacterium]